MAPIPLPAFIDDTLNRAFLRQLLRAPRGRATVLRSLADEEGGNGGELDIFGHMLAAIDDDELKKLVRVHQADEERHERLFADAAARDGVAPLPIPDDARLLYLLDAHLGFFTRPITDHAGVVDAYLLLQVIEERALKQFARQRRSFHDVGDHATVAVIDAVAADEARHLKYCDAISRRFAVDDAARLRRLDELRALEERCFQEVQRRMLLLFVDAGLMDDGPLRLLWRGLAALARRQEPDVAPPRHATREAALAA
jgi:hypothetical protein